MKNYRYAGRVYLDRALKEKVRDDVQVIAQAFIRYDQRLDIEKGDFERHGQRYTHRGYLRAKERGSETPSGFTFVGNSETQVYLDLIRAFIDDGLYFPIL
ncbi:hypothetical protein MKX42_30735 [Paenibacillus sp. FSL R7-0204]|uniref:hypothetical protein n=1 Tax=Paenibacillus sp. FSL R7-0204 TaxID=2921675 RepID=UPI0030F89AD0